MTHIGIGEWREDGRRYRLVVTLELRLREAGGFQTVEHEPVPPGSLEFSATHTIIDRAKRRGNDEVAGGAGLPELPDDVEFDAGWDAVRYAELRAIGERWHMNTLRAACAHQTIEMETDKYGRRVGSLDLTQPCPVSGYRYGSAWLVELLPADVLTFLSTFDVPVPVR